MIEVCSKQKMGKASININGKKAEWISGHVKELEEEEQPWPLWLSWLEHHLVDWKLTGSIPSQRTYTGCRFNPIWAYKRRQPTDVSLSYRHFFQQWKKCPQVRIRKINKKEQRKPKMSRSKEIIKSRMEIKESKKHNRKVKETKSRLLEKINKIG